MLFIYGLSFSISKQTHPACISSLNLLRFLVSSWEVKGPLAGSRWGSALQSCTGTHHKSSFRGVTTCMVDIRENYKQWLPLAAPPAFGVFWRGCGRCPFLRSITTYCSVLEIFSSNPSLEARKGGETGEVCSARLRWDSGFLLVWVWGGGRTGQALLNLSAAGQSVLQTVLARIHPAAPLQASEGSCCSKNATRFAIWGRGNKIIRFRKCWIFLMNISGAFQRNRVRKENSAKVASRQPRV